MTQVPLLPPRSTTWLVLGSLLLATASGCSGPSQNADRPSLASTSAPRPVAMQGEGRFFDGQVVATLSVSRGFLGMSGAHGKKGQQYDVIELPDPDDKDYIDSMIKIQALLIRGNPLPPVTLRLNLANQAKQPLEVEIRELNSDLGNFAVQPDKLTIAPGQSAEPYQMNSELGVFSDEIPVKLVLRCAGKTESQVVSVQSLFTPDGKRK